MKKTFICLILAVFFMQPLFAATKITVKGSDTMVVVAQRWAEVYQGKNRDVTIQVTGGGSGVGIAALINGTTDIANSSREIRLSEKQQAMSFGHNPQEFKVGMDALSVVVNKDNPVNELTLKQIQGIFIGAYTNWSQVGGKNDTILVYSREASSGTYVFFKEHVLQNKDYASNAQTLQGTAAVAEAVAHDPKGIGYGGAAYFIGRPELKIIKVKKDDKSPAIAPVSSDGKSVNYAVIYDHSYPIWRYLYCYTGKKPGGVLKAYLDWIMGPEGQEIAAKEGYVPLPGKQ